MVWGSVTIVVCALSSPTSTRSNSTRNVRTRPASVGVNRFELPPPPPPLTAPVASCERRSPAASPTDPAFNRKAICVTRPRSLRTVAADTEASVSDSRRICSEKNIAPSSSKDFAMAPDSRRAERPTPSAWTSHSRLLWLSDSLNDASVRESGTSTPDSNCARSAASVASPAETN
eukprot:scaffold259326_cov27-Tisochrysis_lutea.AAC.4